MFLEEKEQPYVLTLSGKAYMWAGFHQHRVSGVLEALRKGELPPEEDEEGWQRLSAGDGSKGPRFYDWLRLALNPPLQEGFHRDGFWCAAPSKSPKSSLHIRSSLPKVLRSEL